VVSLIRPLVSSDAAALEAFLRPHADWSMFLRSNARAAGLDYHGNPLEADYVGAFEGERIVAVAAHCWNGVVLLQAPVLLEAVVQRVVRRSGREITGLSGPASQVRAARTLLGLDGRPAPKLGPEELFALDLAELVVPGPLADGHWECRHPRETEMELITDWRVGFFVEALHGSDGPGVREQCGEEVRLLRRQASDWLLLDGGRPVSYSNFNARLPDIVQIGGVWTPPPLRGQGYGAAVVAGSLIHAREHGVRRAVLFAEREAAKRAYRRIGFRPLGAYGLVLFR
jgi:GNAT superfamily N-acetyltransferase